MKNPMKLFNVDKSKDIFCFLPVCNESEEELMHSLSIFSTSNIAPSLRKRILLFIVLDGQSDNQPQTATYTILQNRLFNKEKRETYPAFGCTIEKGYIEDIPFYFCVKGDNLLKGKRYSMLLYAEISKYISKYREKLGFLKDRDTFNLEA